jgi:hypothetical protein
VKPLRNKVAQARRDIAEMAQVLAELELVSHGRTMRPDGRVAGSKDPSPILRVDEEPYPHETFRAMWDAAETAERRAQVLADAKTALEAMRKAPPPPDQFLVRGTFAWERMIALDDETPIVELARLHGISRKTIHAWRKKHRPDVEPDR